MLRKLEIPVIVLVVVVIAAGLRFFGLEYQSLWSDEMFSIGISRDHGLLDIIQLTGADVHPPGYQILLAIFIKLFGDSEAGTRLLSALAGTFSVYVIYLLGKQLFSVKEGILAAAILCISNQAIFYSQEARSFSLLLLSVLVCALLFQRILDDIKKTDSPNKNLKYSYIASCIFTMYVHYYGLLFIMLQTIATIIFFYSNKPKLFSFIKLYLIIYAFLLPWIPTLANQLHIKQFWIPEPTIRMVAEYVFFVFNNSLLAAIIAVFIIGVGLILAGLKFNSKFKSCQVSDILQSPYTLLIFWFFTPIVLTYIKSILSTPILTHRNLIICFPPAYLLLSRSIVIIVDSMVNKKLVNNTLISLVSIAIVVYGLQSLLKGGYYENPNKAQYREPVKDIVQHNFFYPNPKLIATDSWFDFYLNKKNIKTDLLARNEEDLTKIEDVVKDAGYFWYLEGHGIPDLSPLYNKLSEEYEKVTTIKYYMTKITLFKKREGIKGA